MTTPRGGTKRQPTHVQVASDDIKIIKEQLAALSTNVSRIETVIVGDPKFNQIGLIAQVKSHADYIEIDKGFKSKLVGAGVVVGALWTIVLKFWK